MMVFAETIVAAFGAFLIPVGALLVLAVLADRFGVDSRPGIDERDLRPWL